jgi:hypothetical protein
VSLDGGSRPVWSRDGRELIFRAGAGYMTAPVSSKPDRFGRPVALTVPIRSAFGGTEYYGHPGYDVAPDGRLLIIEQPPEEAAPRQIHVVVNWFEELKRRVPTR